MAKNTSIQWTDHTLNFWWGCTKVSPACRHCYAEEIGRRFGKMHFGAPVLWGDSHPRQHRLEAAHAEAIALDKQAAKKGVRYRVFVNSMSDWLDDKVPVFWLASLLETIRMCPNLDFQLLTKRPENWRERVERCLIYAQGDDPIADYQDYFYRNDGMMPKTDFGLWLNDWTGDTPPSNIWIGTTVENQEWADKRIPALLCIPAKVRFLSCEPFLGLVDLHSAITGDGQQTAFNTLRNIHWVITGGESGRQATPSHPDWFRSLRDQCHAANVPFFFKQWGEWVSVSEVPGPGTHHQFDDGATVRRAGTQAAGNLLDGTPHLAFPTP